MEIKELLYAPLTPLEKALKQCFQIRPIFKNHVPNTDEMMEYIQWMASEFGERPEYQFSADAIFAPDFNLSNNRISTFGARLMDDPKDTIALQAISDSFQEYKEDMFFSDEYDISAGRMLRYIPSHWHSNDHFEVYFSFSGDCPAYFTNETVTVKPGTVLIIAPNVVHATPCFSDDCSLMFYMLRASTFNRVFWNQIPSENLMASFFRRALSDQQPNSYLQFDTGNDPDIQQLLIKVYNESTSDNSYRSQMMNTLMSEFFILLLRRYEGTARLPRNDDFYWKHEYSAILSYIQSHFSSVSLQELSDRFHYNEKQIRRIIQSSTGMSFTQLVTRLRMERAVVMLRRNISVEKVTYSIGYTTVNSFYRTFSRYYGCTPGQYLEQN